MNRIELFIYDRLKGEPKIKLFIRDIYQMLLDAVPQKKVVSSYPITARDGYFFGFHDHSPFSPNNQLLAACKYDLRKPLRMPLPHETIVVGIWKGADYSEWIPIDQTRAWNWHQGCKLQWRGGMNELVFNDHVDGENIARMINLDTGQTTIVPQAIGAVSPDGKIAVGYSYNRVNRYMPGYGYSYDTGEGELEQKIPKKDGLSMIDLDRCNVKDVLPIADISSMEPENSMIGAYHFFSHTIFCPSNCRFVFLHRWIHNDVRKRWSRIISADIELNNIRIYPTKDMVSHLSWRNENQLLAYCRLRDDRDRYVLFEDENPEQYEVIGEEVLRSDGHPSWACDQSWFVTDTYPDRFRRQKLIVYNVLENKCSIIARLKTFKKFATLNPYRHWSCDLHPRCDRIGRFLCFDATFSGNRALCTMDFGQVIDDVKNIKTID